MKTKRVLRYYCEFCGKGGCGAHAMKVHEKHCTMNPDRECRECLLIGSSAAPLAELKAMMPPHPDPKSEYESFTIQAWHRDALKAVMRMADDCPMCVLAAIRQSGWTSYELDYNYSAACEAARQRANAVDSDD